MRSVGIKKLSLLYLFGFLSLILCALRVGAESQLVNIPPVLYFCSTRNWGTWDVMIDFRNSPATMVMSSRQDSVLCLEFYPAKDDIALLFSRLNAVPEQYASRSSTPVLVKWGNRILRLNSKEPNPEGIEKYLFRTSFLANVLREGGEFYLKKQVDSRKDVIPMSPLPSWMP